VFGFIGGTVALMGWALVGEWAGGIFEVCCVRLSSLCCPIADGRGSENQGEKGLWARSRGMRTSDGYAYPCSMIMLTIYLCLTSFSYKLDPQH